MLAQKVKANHFLDCINVVVVYLWLVYNSRGKTTSACCLIIARNENKPADERMTTM